MAMVPPFGANNSFDVLSQIGEGDDDQLRTPQAFHQHKCQILQISPAMAKAKLSEERREDNNLPETPQSFNSDTSHSSDNSISTYDTHEPTQNHNEQYTILNMPEDISSSSSFSCKSSTIRLLAA